MTIPARLHFCWIGPSLPWAYGFALLSAAARSGMTDVVLHHTHALEAGPVLDALDGAGIRRVRIRPAAYLEAAGRPLGIGGALAALYARIESPAILSDILRVAILYHEGGIYLDLDTVTVASLEPLLADRQFLGSEFIVWPYAVRRSRSPLRLARHAALDLARKTLRVTPGGWRTFRHIERFYFRGLNGAAMGSAPGAPFVADCLRAMIAVPQERQAQPCALGPDLQEAVAAQHHGDLTIHAPHVFFPLPPEISEHWFRPARQVDLGAVLMPETRVVHWYASVRTKAHVARIGPAYVRANRGRQLYSALVDSVLPDFSSGLPPDPP